MSWFRRRKEEKAARDHVKSIWTQIDEEGWAVDFEGNMTGYCWRGFKKEDKTKKLGVTGYSGKLFKTKQEAEDWARGD